MERGRFWVLAGDLAILCDRAYPSRNSSISQQTQIDRFAAIDLGDGVTQRSHAPGEHGSSGRSTILLVTSNIIQNWKRGISDG